MTAPRAWAGAAPGARARWRRGRLRLNARELIELSRLRADKHAQWDVRDRTNAIVALVDAVHPAIAWACGGPGSHPFPGVRYSAPSPPHVQPVLIALDDPMRVSR